MDHDTFIGTVQERGQLPSRGAAEAATRATLEVLTERLAGGLPDNLGAQLPGDLGRHLSTDGTAESFGPEEFHARVAARQPGGVDADAAATHVTAVLTTLREAVEHDPIPRMRDQLTDDYEQLLAAAG